MEACAVKMITVPRAKSVSSQTGARRLRERFDVVFLLFRFSESEFCSAAAVFFCGISAISAAFQGVDAGRERESERGE